MYPAFSFDGRTGNGGGLASLTRTVLPVGRCSTGPVIQRIRTWLLGAEKRFGALYVCIWYTGQALSQLQRLCPALPGVCQPPSSVRGTCIVVPHAALLAVPDAPPRFFAHRARSAPVPQGAPVCEPSQVQCCTLADHGPGAQNPVWFQKEEPPHVWGFFLLESGSVLLSRAVTSQVPSALKGLTSVFGMGTGGSLSP